MLADEEGYFFQVDVCCDYRGRHQVQKTGYGEVELLPFA